MNGSHNEFVQLSKNKPTREHNVTLHHSLPITLRYIKERRKTMRSEAASSHRATSNPQSTIRSSFQVHFISENHWQTHGQKMAVPLLTNCAVGKVEKHACSCARKIFHVQYKLSSMGIFSQTDTDSFAKVHLEDARLAIVLNNKLLFFLEDLLRAQHS